MQGTPASIPGGREVDLVRGELRSDHCSSNDGNTAYTWHKPVFETTALQLQAAFGTRRWASCATLQAALEDTSATASTQALREVLGAASTMQEGLLLPAASTPRQREEAPRALPGGGRPARWGPPRDGSSTRGSHATSLQELSLWHREAGERVQRCPQYSSQWCGGTAGFSTLVGLQGHERGSRYSKALQLHQSHATRCEGEPIGSEFIEGQVAPDQLMHQCGQVDQGGAPFVIDNHQGDGTTDEELSTKVVQLRARNLEALEALRIARECKYGIS